MPYKWHITMLMSMTAISDNKNGYSEIWEKNGMNYGNWGPQIPQQIRHLKKMVFLFGK